MYFAYEVKHLEKNCSVFGRHLISINFPLKKWEGYYSAIVGGFLHLKVGINSLILWKSRHNIPPTPTPCDLSEFGS
jgi:hypothetical protein